MHSCLHDDLPVLLSPCFMPHTYTYIACIPSPARTRHPSQLMCISTIWRNRPNSPIASLQFVDRSYPCHQHVCVQRTTHARMISSFLNRSSMRLGLCFCNCTCAASRRILACELQAPPGGVFNSSLFNFLGEARGLRPRSLSCRLSSTSWSNTACPATSFAMHAFHSSD